MFKKYILLYTYIFKRQKKILSRVLISYLFTSCDAYSANENMFKRFNKPSVLLLKSFRKQYLRLTTDFSPVMC